MLNMAQNKGSFLVQVLDTQNSTWQGVVTCTETGKTVPFRSALELIKLIDSTLPGGSLTEE